MFALGGLIRFDTAQDTWRSGSSPLLRKRQFRRGSNLFHIGILIVIGGHFTGFRIPDWAVDWLISPAQHELLAMVVGGPASLIAIVGLSLLIHRRLTDPRIRTTSRRWDIAIKVSLNKSYATRAIYDSLPGGGAFGCSAVLPSVTVSGSSGKSRAVKRFWRRWIGWCPGFGSKP
ncbi:respiratory nitrate reductase subunit gamma [Acidisphaera sp. S103]|uniref:respiratory nitrate reductase subunit gamma n=1 Tax=Acidisphaera sp. S103 TaxID=1747223 RepID=UPI0020B14174|nr:respiratory nitrate reductase subunit gamma [Acidisphaera sp. S103]